MTILLIILAIIAIPFILALFMRKEYRIVRETVIDQPTPTVFEFVKKLKNQERYNKWTMMDPNVRKEMKGTDGTVGFIATWDSDNKKVGTGQQEIVEIKEGERIRLALQFFKPFKGKANASMNVVPQGSNQTKLTWEFNSGMNYPMNIMIPLLNIEKLLGKDLDESLVLLKSILENKN